MIRLHVSYDSRESESASPTPKKMRLDPFAELRDCTSSTSGQQSADLTALIQSELANYKSIKVPPASSNPLKFWEQQATDYPIMSRTARRLFCITASSAQSERDFSSVGRTVSEMRSRLNEDTIEAVELLRWGMRAGILHSVVS